MSQDKYKSNCIIIDNKRKYKSAFVISKGKKTKHRSYKIIKKKKKLKRRVHA